MTAKSEITPFIVRPNKGRKYPMGRMSAVLKADLAETNSSVSVSESWLEPDTEGPHVHTHLETHIYYVIAGSLAVFLEGQRSDTVQDSTIYITGGTEHSFENRSHAKVGFISFNSPGRFEASVPGVVRYLEAQPLGHAKHDS